MTKTADFEADNLYRMANKVLETNMTEADCRKEDVTDIYNHEIEMRIIKGELINMNYNGTVRKGKSTAAIAECHRIKQLIELHHKVKRPLTNANIARDQNEYSRIVKKRPNDYKHECDVIDEWAEMEEAGYNATVEQKYLKDFSDRQAGRYYHRIACSPHNITDPNTDILVEIIATNKENKETLIEQLRRFHQQSGFYEIKEYMQPNFRQTLHYLRRKGFNTIADDYMREWDKI